MLQRWLLLWLTSLSLVAYFWVDWFGDSLDPFRATKPFLPHLFAATMFAIGCLLPRDEITQVFRRWPSVLGGTAIQYAAMPALAYAMGRVFHLQGDVLLGVIMVGCVPGAMASNVLTLTARGNVSYSVSLTTMATLLSPLVVPAALYVTIEQADIDKTALVKKAAVVLILQVVGPVVTGHLLSSRLARLQKTMQTLGPIVANLTILWIIAVVVHANRDNLQGAGPQLAGVLIAINLLGYVAGFSGGSALRLSDGMRRALTLEVGMQNAGLGTILAQQLFEEHKLVALPPALYTFGCMLTGTILAQIWSRHAPRHRDGTTQSPLAA